MKSFITACVAAIVIAVCGAVILGFMQMPVSDAFNAGSSVRI
jgi:hypothetical protein